MINDKGGWTELNQAKWIQEEHNRKDIEIVLKYFSFISMCVFKLGESM